MSDLIPDMLPLADDERGVDPTTGRAWALLIDTEQTQLYLERVYGIRRSRQTLAHQRSLGVGIKWKYVGQKPLTSPREVDRHVREELLRDQSPLTTKARARAAKQRAAQQRPAKKLG